MHMFFPSENEQRKRSRVNCLISNNIITRVLAFLHVHHEMLLPTSFNDKTFMTFIAPVASIHTIIHISCSILPVAYILSQLRAVPYSHFQKSGFRFHFKKSSTFHLKDRTAFTNLATAQ